MNKEDNLRGRLVAFPHPDSGVWLRGTVITHTRGERWLVQSAALPVRYQRPWNGVRRISLERDEFIVEESA